MADLAARVREAALLEGDFVLSSGRRSRFYVDKYLFSTEPGLLGEISRELAGRIPGGVDRLAGVELGAVPLVVAVSLQSGLPYVIVRRSGKSYGTAREIEGRLQEGESVVLLEDVVTTGAQALAAAERLCALGCRVERIVAVLDRRERPEERLGRFHFEALLRMGDLGVDTPV
ncbi:orotate phosphoribosyltransferase [Rubrobacter calidifluminis]|uniref:orotate phosphoribosyltransferase n=1 Tax=Rubrobacter calidifluminis TaxID=1392640 RepID=UPI00235E45ED|nr:orotate phosphoribosyltransferase [Rubrobacter calidifluminis]